MSKMLTVRVSDEEAEALDAEVRRSNTTASELLRTSLRSVLARADAERDAAIYDAYPLTSAELLDPEDQTWLPEEDWSSWRVRLEKR
jgi:Arc/MetJ-type ribon-helix-helix transcriptional regulator